MRANYKLKRLFIPDPLAEGVAVEAARDRAHYLLNVLRLEPASELLLFNGRDGEWRARIEVPARKKAVLVPLSLERPQPSAPDLLFCFAPIKAGRLDWMVEKAVEMGAGAIQPVLTEFTQNHRLNKEKLAAWALEAAQQCGVLALAEIREPVKLGRLVEEWEGGRRLIFCDEDSATDNPLPALGEIREKSLALLTGPEGGFSDEERRLLRSQPFVTAIPLGPRILRADTAAVAALTAIQMVLGDWGRDARNRASTDQS